MFSFFSAVNHNAAAASGGSDAAENENPNNIREDLYTNVHNFNQYNSSNSVDSQTARRAQAALGELEKGPSAETGHASPAHRTRPSHVSTEEEEEESKLLNILSEILIMGI